MSEEKHLNDVLVELMMLTEKYNFSVEDKLIVMDRCLLLGEACAFLESLGLLEELRERHKKVCENTAELMS